MPRTHPKIDLARKVELLFERGKALGLPLTYRAIAEQTGENANNIRKIHRGLNDNPGLRTLEALARYFRVSLAYFECETEQACRDFLAGVAHAEQANMVSLRASELSTDGLKALQDMAEHLIQFEAGRQKKRVS